MAGAYTAKPEEDSTPDVPDGWDIDWPFPGPPPPGYEFDYGFNFDAPDIVVPGAAVSGNATLVDHDTHKTETPDEGKTATLSAKWNDTQEDVAVEEGENIISYVEEEGGFNAIYFDAKLDVSEADEGRIVDLFLESIPFPGEKVTGTCQLEVRVPADLRAVLTITWSHSGYGTHSWTEPEDPLESEEQITYTAPNWYIRFDAGFEDFNHSRAGIESHITTAYFEVFTGIIYHTLDGVEVSCSGFSSGSATIAVNISDYFTDYIYFWYYTHLVDATLATTWILKVYDGDELLSTNSSSISPSVGYEGNYVFDVRVSDGDVNVY